jgi:hypothetical protein
MGCGQTDFQTAELSSPGLPPGIPLKETVLLEVRILSREFDRQPKSLRLESDLTYAAATPSPEALFRGGAENEVGELRQIL